MKISDATKTTPTPDKPKKVLRYQLAAFFLTAFVYGLSHASRTVWGYVKSYFAKSNPYFTNSKLGVLDFAFMSSYAVGQYISGFLADRVNLKVFLFIGLSSAASTLCLFGYIEGFLQMESLAIATLAFIVNGLGQSTGYSSCVSITSNWFKAAKNGLVFGLWGTCLNIGDILGQQIGRITISIEGLGWQYAIFITCGILMFLLLILEIFVKVHPKDLVQKESIHILSLEVPLVTTAADQEGAVRTEGQEKPIRFLDAWRIKHVPCFAFGFFCVKGVIYGTMFWLPFYLTNEVELEGDISLVLASIEIGMLFGSIFLGFLSDRTKSRASMIAFGFFFAVIFLVITYLIKSLKIKALYFTLLLLAGMGIGGPASLIGGAVSSDLGRQHLVEKNGVSAVATVAGIMEGCGALGAAITQLVVSNFTEITFPFFAVMCLFGGIMMIPIAVDDYKERKRRVKTSNSVAHH